MAWLRHHSWRWIEQRLNEVLSECLERSTALCGSAYNMADYLARFDLVILLQIDDATMVRRLTDIRVATMTSEGSERRLSGRWTGVGGSKQKR